MAGQAAVVEKREVSAHVPETEVVGVEARQALEKIIANNIASIVELENELFSEEGMKNWGSEEKLQIWNMRKNDLWKGLEFLRKTSLLADVLPKEQLSLFQQFMGLGKEKQDKFMEKFREFCVNEGI